MTNSEKCLTLVQVMTNIASSALAGSENIIANICSQVNDETYYAKATPHKVHKLEIKHD